MDGIPNFIHGGYDECHLLYYEFMHSLNVIWGGGDDTQKNQLPINLCTFMISFFLPKLLENYGTSNDKQIPKDHKM
jgi:hypothetical protein